MNNVVLIGGGQASAWAAYTLRNNGFEGDIAVISKESNVFYERPPLSKDYLAGNANLESLSFFPPDIIEKLNISWYLEDEVIDINKISKIVTLKSEQILAYDKLLIATGSEAKIPVPEWASMSKVLTLRTIDDANRIKENLNPGCKLAIIGGGWIGLEIAATARDKEVDVSIFELAPRLCQRSTMPEISQLLYDMHIAHGNQITLSINSIHLQENAHGQIEIYDGKDLLLTADMLILGVGAKLNTELAVIADFELTNGAIHVDEQCRTSDLNIYAAGDVAIHPKYNYSLQSYQHAQNQGIVAAKSMLGIEAEYKDIPWIWSDQFNNNMQILGFPSSEKLKCVTRMTDENKKTLFYFSEKGDLEFVFTLNDSRSIKLSKKWISAKIKLPQEELADAKFNLMSLKV